MKKIFISLLVLACCAPAMAATTVDAVGGVGTITITVTVTDDDVVRGLAVAVEQTDSDPGDGKLAAGTDVSAPDFNTYIDWAMTNPAGYTVLEDIQTNGHAAAKIDAAGAIDDAADNRLPAADFSVSVGYLDQGKNQGGLDASGSPYVITIDLTGTADTDFDVTLDTLRGGVVGDDLEVSGNVSTGTTVTVTFVPPFPSCVDYNLTKKKQGATDPVVNVSDITLLVNYIDAYKISDTVFVVSPVSPNYDADYNFDQSSPAINVGDISKMINFMDTYKLSETVFVVNCDTCGC